MTQQYDVKTFESEEIPAQSLRLPDVVSASPISIATHPILKSSVIRKPDVHIHHGTTALAPRKKQTRRLLHRQLTRHHGPSSDSPKGTPASWVTVAIQLRLSIRGHLRHRTRDGPGSGSSQKLLVVAVARARNTGMKIFNDDRLLQRGSSPVLWSP